MSAAPRISQASAPHWSQHERQFMALYGAMMPSYAPRYGRMQTTGAKYLTSNNPVTATLLAQHYRGNTTVGSPLTVDGLACTAGMDVDAGGRAAVERALAAAATLGTTAYAILMDGPEHQGGHVFTTPYPPTPAHVLKAHAARIRDAAGLSSGTELYPTGALLRLPFGVHVRNHTRGVLLLQDGRTFDLDNSSERHTGLAAVRTLPQNTLDGQNATHEPAHVATIELDAARLAACWEHKAELLVEHNGKPEPAVFKGNTNVPGLRVLRGTLTPRNNRGTLDTSDALYIGVKSLVWHGRTPESIIVIATECYAFDSVRTGRKTAAAVRVDIERCITKCIAELATEGRAYVARPYSFEYVKRSASSQLAPPPHPTPVRAATPGRRRILSDIDYRTKAAQLADGRDEHGNPRLLMSRAELAQRLGIKPSTAAYIERRLTSLGLWERRQVGQHGSVATALPGTTSCFEGRINTFAETVEGRIYCPDDEPTESAEYAIATPQNANDEAAHIGGTPPLSPSAGGDAPDAAHAGAEQAGVPPSPRPPLAVQIDEALAVYGDVPRRRRALVVDYLAANYGKPRVSAQVVQWEIDAGLDRRFLHALTQDALYKEQRKRQRLHDRELAAVKVKRTPGEHAAAPDTVELVTTHVGNPKRATKFGYALARVEAVVLGRGLPLEQPRMKRRKRGEPKPAATVAMQRYIELATSEPEPEPIAPPPPPSSDVAGLVQRLKARIQQEAISP